MALITGSIGEEPCFVEHIFGLQVLTNGTTVGSNGYRIREQHVKLQVGTSVTDAHIRCRVAPLAANDRYYVARDTALTVPTPGVLSNDVARWSGVLTAMLVSGPAHGVLDLNTDSGFSYTPATNFSGLDSFSCQANDGVTNSGTATVTICVAPPVRLFADDFTRQQSVDFLTNQITVHFDGVQVANVTDDSFDGTPAYLSGSA